MPHSRGRGPSAWGLGLAVAAILAGALAVWAADPVEELRQILQYDEGRNPSETALEARRKNLQKKIDALKTVGQFRRALVLTAWNDDPLRAVNVDKELRRIDADMRQEVANRFKNALDQQARSPDANSRLAVANVIAELGPTARDLGLGPNERGPGYARTLFPIVAALTKDSDLGVRQEALRAVSNSNPVAKEAARVIADRLRNDAALGPRRVAADALGQLVRVVSQLNKPGKVVTTTVIASRAEVIDVLQEVLRTAPIGLADDDSNVRSACADAILTATTVFLEFLEVPPAIPTEKGEALERSQLLKRDLDEFKPVLSALRDAVAPRQGGLVALLGDRDPNSRFIGAEALQSIALVRQRLRQRILESARTGGAAKDAQSVLAELDPLGSFLETRLGVLRPLFADSDVRLRKTAVTFALHIDERALPLAPLLIASLNDPDRFVRWTAVRALGNLPSEQVASSAAALARLLRDDDVSVRIAAANALEAMGKYAEGTQAALAQAATAGDAEPRIAAMHALAALGPSAVQAALPQLIEVLSQRDADSKVLVAAAETLAELGPAARGAIPSLRRLIGHEDSDVRAAASEAILSISNENRR